MKVIRSNKGFTLIELMIVVLIIAILVAIAVPVYINTQENAKKRACQDNVRTVDGQIQAYQASEPNQSYPANLAALVTGKFLKSTPMCSKSASGTYAWITGTPPYISCTVHPPVD
ncbi:MAG: prepilin-type N-terminal cleavage/methylation domain-containing protein [Actinomycetota bacterium]|nr:prepilin-type N-terminal cleavage/methylation domain-containing protein [Actinomycetota bacterium]